jgi:hypothetical protein
MPDIHDLLGKLSNDESSSSSGRENKTGSGITPLDIANLPEKQKRVMFYMLRDKKAASDGLSLQALEDMFPDEYLVDSIQQLTEENWLTVTDNGLYKLNLRRSRKRIGSDDLWAAISND